MIVMYIFNINVINMNIYNDHSTSLPLITTVLMKLIYITDTRVLVVPWAVHLHHVKQIPVSSCDPLPLNK